jgi:hypothetical protein
MTQTELGHFAPEPQLSLILLQPTPAQKESDAFFSKYLSPQPLNGASHAPSTSTGFLGRATYAASSIFVTRDASGKGKLNTQYLMGMLSLAAAHAAYRPYWARSASSTFNDFGASIGSNAGISVLHEFQPGLEQRMRSHTPRFVYRLQQRIIPQSTPKE